VRSDSRSADLGATNTGAVDVATYAEDMGTITNHIRKGSRGSIAPDHEGSATLAPARPDPALDDGDHDRMAHIVLEGYTPKKGDFISAGPSVVEGIVNGTAVRALCGKEWVPGRNPQRYGLCPTCKEIAQSMGWKIPAT
jgi:hypothetical protein